MLLSYRNDNERVTLEQQECETDTHTEKEKDIYTFIKNIHLDNATAATGQREPIKCMHSPHTSYRWRGERDNQVYALTTHQLQVERRESHRANQVYALTTHQLQVERRERHRANQVFGHTI